MSPKFVRRLHRNLSSSRKDFFFKKENSEQKFFGGSSIHDIFFLPSNKQTSIQRKYEKCEEDNKKIQHLQEQREEDNNSSQPEQKEEDKKLQIKEASQLATGSTNFTSSPYINTLKSKGQFLSKQQQNFFGSRMGYDFSNVRIHTGTEAEKSAREVNAKAYTVGNDIVFNKGQYHPESIEGKKLLAHELTHVMQKNNNEGIQRKLNETCKGTGFKIYKNSVGSIDFLIGLTTNDEKRFAKKMDSVIGILASGIQSDNKLIKDTKQQVSKCFIVSGIATRLVNDNGNNVLLIAPKNADEQTIAHEMGHAVFSFLLTNKDNSLMDTSRTDRLLLKKLFKNEISNYHKGLW